MAPWRSFDRELDVGLIVLLAVLLAVVVGSGALKRHRERGERGQDGGRGYTPADLRPVAAAPVRGPVDPTERWLLGLAAPFVETAGLLHGEWALTPHPRDAAWQRQLDRWLAHQGVTDPVAWEDTLHELERHLETAEEELLTPEAWATVPEEAGTTQVPDHRPWFVARIAYVCRLGASAGHVSADESRERVRDAAWSLRDDVTDWFGFADAFLSSAAAVDPPSVPRWRATIRGLYAPGGPWADVVWPDAARDDEGMDGERTDDP